MKSVVSKQASDALLAGVASCTITGLFATQSDLAFDAFKMALLLTAVVPPAILLAGRFIKD